MWVNLFVTKGDLIVTMGDLVGGVGRIIGKRFNWCSGDYQYLGGHGDHGLCTARAGAKNVARGGVRMLKEID